MNEALTAYRDDGPLARALGGLAGRALPVPGALLSAAAAAVMLAAIVLGGDGASEAVAGAVVAAAILLGGLANARAEQGSFRWLVPPTLRLTEYAGLLWLGSLAGNSGVPAAFTLILALAFRHYDLVYRLRHRGVTPPPWVDLVGLGWEGRLALGYVVLVAGVLPTAFFVLAGIFAAVFVTESVAGWMGSVRGQTAIYEEEEDEGQ